MIFGNIETEKVLQLNDRTRIDARKTYLSPDESAITKIEIQPEIGTDFQDVTSNKYLDWSYDSSGTKNITLRITTDSNPQDFTRSIIILTPEQDNLFSSDADLLSYEDDILNYVRDGRNSFLDKHRASQIIILDDLDSAKIWKRDGSRYKAEDIIDIQDFKQWSIFLTLKIIFESLSNAVDDIFSQKAEKYSSMAINAKSRASLRLDRNQNGEIDREEIDGTDIQTGLLFRR
jgi:hypothetical protein